MTNDDRDEALESYLDGTSDRYGDASSHPHNGEDRADVESLTDVADLLREAAHGAPPLASDPLAAMLGLRPDPQHSLDPRALARARKNARLKASDLASRLTARGWDIQSREVFRWENQTTADVPPALIKAIAEVTGARIESLVVSRSAAIEHEALAEVARSGRFAILVERWARIQGVPSALAASTLEARMLATVHRGDRPDGDQVLRSLEAFINAVDDRRASS